VVDKSGLEKRDTSAETGGDRNERRLGQRPRMFPEVAGLHCSPPVRMCL
jgi:hypothetical protein